MRQIEFTVPGTPGSKARARASAQHSGILRKNPKTGRIEEKVWPHMHTPDTTATYENLVRITYSSVCQDPPFEGPVLLYVKAFFPIPKSMRKALRLVAEQEQLPVLKTPDSSNVYKAVEDGLNSVAYLDDRLIFDHRCTEYYSPRPRTEVHLTFISLEELCLNPPSASASSARSCASPGRKMTSSSQTSLRL